MNKPDKQVKTKIPNPEGIGGFKPGVSGNPNGRPKSGHAITDIIRQLGAKNAKGCKSKTQREKLLENIYKLATEDNEKWACEFIANYDQGRPVQTVDITDTNLEPIKGIDVG